VFRVLDWHARPRALAAVKSRKAIAIQAGSGARFVAVQDNLRSWVLRKLGRFDEADEWTHRALELSGSHRSSMNEMYYAGRLDLIEGRLLTYDFDGARKVIEGTAEAMSWNGAQAWHPHQKFLSLSAQHALATEDYDRAAAVASGVVADSGTEHSLRYSLFARLTVARARLAAGCAIDRDELDGVLVELERCAGLEAWRQTAELAAGRVDRWWRDAERRAGALVVHGGEHGEALRRYVATTLTRSALVQVAGGARAGDLTASGLAASAARKITRRTMG
jgi:hypothetical protein